MNEDQLDNVLIHQKDRILDLIHLAEAQKNLSALEKAEAFLSFCHQLWNTCDYNYKWKELNEKLLKVFEEHFV